MSNPVNEVQNLFIFITMSVAASTHSYDLKSLLKNHFGFNEFLPLQKEIISNVLSGKDTVAIMPTGGGKSLCYQLPALASPGTALVISPLIALMKDQVDALKNNGIKAEYFNSSQLQEEQRLILERLKEGKIDLLYVAPESLSLIQPVLKTIEINLIAIDEAHCISAWGHDFRPAYLQLGILKELFPTIPVIALTATADRATREDMITQLKLPDAKIFIASFDRPNLMIDIRGGQNRRPQILRFLRSQNSESGIIYCLSRKGTEDLATYLKSQGFSAEAYHAGMTHEERTSVQEDFINDRIQIVVATIAFGMGIDKSNVRWVIHYNMPKNIEGYYQEIGRAGRDGLPAHTILFHSYSDIITLRKFADNSENREYHYAKLDRMKQFCDAFNCRRKMLLGYFGEHIENDCGNCDNCKSPPKFFNGTIIAQKILSAIARLKEKEPITVVTDVLRGAKNQTVLEKRYHEIKTYGAVKDISWIDVQDYIIQLINQGFIEIWFHEHNRLVLTSRAKDVLFHNKKVRLIKGYESYEIKPLAGERKFSEPYERGRLFSILRALRRKIAETESLPPFMIFNDASLEDMEKRKPTTLPEFSDILGVGNIKLEKYGKIFTDEIREYLKNNNEDLLFFDSASKTSGKTLLDNLFQLKERLIQTAEFDDLFNDSEIERMADLLPRSMEEFAKGDFNKETVEKWGSRFLKEINRYVDRLEKDGRPTHERTCHMFFEEKLSPAQIAEKRGLSEETIMNHLLKAGQEGKLNPYDFISEEEVKKIELAREELEDSKELKKYFEYFNERMPYWKIKWGMMLLTKNINEPKI